MLRLPSTYAYSRLRNRIVCGRDESILYLMIFLLSLSCLYALYVFKELKRMKCYKGGILFSASPYQGPCCITEWLMSYIFICKLFFECLMSGCQRKFSMENCKKESAHKVAGRPSQLLKCLLSSLNAIYTGKCKGL